MALVHADNYSIYGTNAALMLNGIYAQNTQCSLATDPDGLSGGKVLQVAAGNFVDSGDRFVLPTLQNTVGMAFRIWFNSLPTGSLANLNKPATFKDISETLLATIRVDATGRLNAYTGGSLLGSTTNPVITANGWYHIEVKVTQGGPAASSIEVRVEGQTVLNLTGQTFTNNNQIAMVQHQNNTDGTGAHTGFYIKDSVVWNGSGSANNTFLGSVLVKNLTPTADASLNWTPSTGTDGYSILDNIPPNDAQYISAPYNAGGPPFYPNPYVGIMSDLPTETTSVKGVITFVRAAKSDGGDGSLQTGIISDPLGTPATGLGTDRPITVAQTYWRDVFELDPKTGAAWLPAAVNLARIQLNRTT